MEDFRESHRRSRLPSDWPLPAQYLLALVAVAAALVARWLLDPLVADRVAFLPLTAALLPLVVLVRPGPFLVSALAGSAASWFLFVAPRMSLGFGDPKDVAVVLIGAAAMTAAAATAQLSRRAMDARDRSLRALEEGDALTRATFDNAAVGIAHVGIDGRWLRFNDRLCAIVGHPRDILRERTFADITHPDDLEEDLRLVSQVMAGEISSYTLEKRYIRQDGTAVPALLTVSLVRSADGSPRHFVSVINDLSERKRLDDELRRRSAQFEMLLNQAPLGVYLIDAAFRLRQVNPLAEPLFARFPGGALGQDFEALIHAIWPTPQADTTVRVFRHTLETGEPHHVPEFAQRRADTGVTEYYDWRIDRILLPDGEYGVVCFFRDISAQVHARLAIARSEERYRTLFTSIDEGFCILEVLLAESGAPVDCRFLETNPAFERHTGLVHAVGRTIRELVPEIESRWTTIYGRVATTSQRERFVQHSPAMGRWFDVDAFPVGTPEQRRVAVLFTDISKRHAAEDLLRKSEERLRVALDAADLGIWDLNLDTGTATCSLRHDQIFGYEELQPEWSLDIFLRHVVPEDRAFAREAHERAAQTGVLFHEVRVLWPDGSIHWIAAHGRLHHASDGRPAHIVGVIADVTARKEAEQALHDSERESRARADELAALMDLVPAVVFQAHDPEGRQITGNRKAHELLRMPLGAKLSRGTAESDQLSHVQVWQDGRETPAGQLPVQRAAAGEQVQDQEMEVRFDDGTVRHLLGNAVPVHDEDDRVRGALAAMIDITDRKRAEESLRDADRRKDAFLATLAHELRNPLAAIRMATTLLGQATDNPGQVALMTTVVERQSLHLVRLIDDLLDVSRISRGTIELKRTRVNVIDIVRHVVEDARTVCGGVGPEVSAALPDRSIFWDADPVRFAQVIGNVLHNACKFTAPGGSVRVSLVREGDDAIIYVTDTGIGIRRDDLTRIFDMFTQGIDQRADGTGGLGIGLSIARTLIEMHGGTIAAKSDGPGRGSEFVVRLPGVHDAPSDVEGHGDNAAGASANAAQTARRILAADDHPDALDVLAIILRLGGHDVATAVDGVQALERADTYRPDVVLLDIGMPGMSGYDVARRIRQEPWGQDMLLVAMTGWGQERDKRRALEAGFDVHLTKPVDPDVLDRLLAEWRPGAPVPSRRSAGQPIAPADRNG